MSNISAASYINLINGIWTTNALNIAIISMTTHWLNEFSQQRSVLNLTTNSVKDILACCRTHFHD